MRNPPVAFFLCIALTWTAHAQEASKQEIWICQGAYQAAPGAPVTPQTRTLILAGGSDQAVMKSDGTERRGRYEASGQHVAAWFEVSGTSGEKLLEEATLGRVTGRLAANLQRADGSRAGVYRGGCRPAELEGPGAGAAGGK